MDFVRVLDEQNTIRQVKSSEINKKQDARDQRNKVTALDCKRSTISLEDVVKIVGGVFKGKRGTIRFINKQTVFLWNKDFH